MLYTMSSMPAYPMGKIGNCPGPRAQGGPAPAEGVIENQRKRGKKKKLKRKKKKKDRREHNSQAPTL